MIFLDAYGLIALLAREPAGAEVMAMLREARAAINVITLAESLDRCSRVEGLPELELRQVVGALIGNRRLRVVALEAEDAWRAASLRTEHYRRRTSELSLADCFLLASATPGEDAIATADPPVAAAARALSIELHALPDPTGRRP